MADNSFIFPRKLLKKLILLYKEQPCLWDRNCGAYKQKHKRHEAISKLTELVQQYDPGATRVHVLRKIESLRACVRREYKRVQESKLKTSDPEDIYTPHLWYYDMFSFVFGEDGNNYRGRGGGSPEQNADFEEDNADVSEEHEDHPFEQSMQRYPAEYNVSTSMIEVADSSPVHKRYAMYDEEPKSGKRHCTEIEDEYDAIGINVAAKLRALPPNTRILAEKLINDVLYQAQMNGLTSSTLLTTPDPFKQDTM